MAKTEPETVTTATYRHRDTGEVLGTVGRYGKQWWGSANMDVRNFDSEAAASAWVREQVGDQAEDTPPQSGV